MRGRSIALLGRRDSPTDALEEYCSWLGRALEPRGWTLELVRVPWAERGWMSALRWLRQQSAGWQGQWVLVQYTALSWSRRGFPIGLLAVLSLLQHGKTRIAVVFHDAEAYYGQRVIDWLRRACQHAVMRIAYAWTARSILTLTVERVSWLPTPPTKAVFIPVGANLPEQHCATEAEEPFPRTAKTIAVFGVTGGEQILPEVRDIAYVVGRVRPYLPDLHLVVLGRNSQEAKEPLTRALNGIELNLSVLGLLPAEDVSRILSRADVLLFVRGQVSSRRGSAIAGIACGLPVVGYAGHETGFPVTEAGVVLVPQGDREALAEALGRVLADDAFRCQLRERSRRAQQEHFSWSAIARRYLGVLEHA